MLSQQPSKSFYRLGGLPRISRPALVKIIKRVCLLVCWLKCSVAFAQTPKVEFRHITLDDGLSNNWVKCIMKDSRGFMWFGTSNGLNRYDGVEFRIFKNKIDNPKSLSNNTINTIFEDNKGNIWIGTQNGLNVFDRKTEEFYTYRYDPGNINSISSNSISRVLAGNDGNIWIATSNGLDVYIPATQKFKHFQNNPKDINSLASNIINDIETDQSGNIWIATRDKGVDLLDVKNNRVTHFGDNGEPGKPSINIARDVHKDEDGNIWIGTGDGGLYLFNVQAKRFKRVNYYAGDSLHIKDDYVTAIANDDEGRLFIGTGRSVYISNTDKNQFYKYASPQEKIGNMSGASPRSIFYDLHANILWLGTENGGLSYTSKAGKIFRHYRSGDDQLNQRHNNLPA